MAVHHPPYSVDAHHGGSKEIGDALDSAFNAAKRWPEMVAGAIDLWKRKDFLHMARVVSSLAHLASLDCPDFLESV